MTQSLALSPAASPFASGQSLMVSMSRLPALGNIDAYISAVNRIPLLTHQEEQQLARDLRDRESVEAAGKLVMSHLRLVVSVARNYLGYGLPHADLIQEGNIGLMKAVKRFDPDRGVRLVSFALAWIKAEIHEYILKNWRMVKVATTKSQRKLFFNLRSMKGDAGTLDSAAVQRIADTLEVKPEEVREMETRFSGGDIALEGNPDDGEDAMAFAPIAYLEDSRTEPTRVLEMKERDAMSSSGIEAAMAKLDDRSRRIIQTRWLNVAEDGSEPMTLQELADEYGVSAERIRQIESAALKKMRGALTEFQAGR
jgi:RNA polymerase sigma-32 factor